MSITTNTDNSDTTTSTVPSPENNAQAASAVPQAQAQPKRTSRRANTAERRATHNAVERARRETLNGRFLDLAAMLPNLANVRRPSKSAIVNSSIAIIQSQRRNRAVAAREMRLIKAENDALRQELNEWRQRANMPRVEEPQRSTDLMAILNFTEEEDAADTRADFDRNYNIDDGDEYADDGDEEQQSPDSYAPYTIPAPLSVTMPVTHNQHQHHAHLQQAQAQAQAQAAAYAQQKAALARVTQAQVQAQAQQLAAVARLPATQQHLIYGAESFFASDSFTLPTAADNAHLFGGNWTQSQQQQQQKAAPQLITPPNSAHGLSTNKTASSFASAANQAFLSSYAAQNTGLGMGMFQHGGPGSAIGEDDNLSVGSGSSHHDGSSSHFSGGASTPEMMMGTSPIDHGFVPNGYSGQSTPPFGVQARRQSLNLPAYFQQQGSSPTQVPQAPFANLSLMI